ncbi:MAG: hypothetical protein AAGA37_23815 [Actinomycetota bacterium]
MFTIFHFRPSPYRAALTLAAFLLITSGCGDDGEASLDGASFSLQNYFSAPDDNGDIALTPFFDQIDATVGDGVEVTNYIYEFDFSSDSISMVWSTDASFDQFEPFVGAASGITQEEASAAPLADEYHFVFDFDISDLTFSADTDAALVVETRVEGADTLVIAVPGGTSIGDGFDAEITVE